MNFKLEARGSLIVGREFIEYCNATILEEILEADKENGWLWPSEVDKHKDLITFYDRDGFKITKYNFGKNWECGRTHSSKSISTLSSRTKATVFNARNAELKKANPDCFGLKDIDMVNGGFTVIYQLAMKFGMKPEEVKNIKLYLDHRDAQLELIMGTFSVDKCLAKNLFIILSFGGNMNTWIKKHNIVDCKKADGFYKKLDIIDGITKECITIGKQYVFEYPEVIAKFAKNKPDNIYQDYDGNKYGTAMACIYHEQENRCLDILMLECGMPKEAYLQHDGATINFDEVYEKTGLTMEEILPVVHSEIERQLGLIVKYEHKSFDANPMPRKQVVRDIDNYLRFERDIFNGLNTFEEKKRYFEIFFCKIKIPEVRFIYQKFDKTSSANTMTTYTEDGLKQWGRNLFYDEVVLKGGKNSKVEVIEKTPFVPEWMRKETMREYDQLTFMPTNKIMEGLGYWDGVDREHFNSFRGYSPKCLPPTKKRLTQNSKDKLLKPWLDVVFELCGGEQEYCDKYLNFLAHMIQKPSEKPPVAFIIKSVQGVGKNKTLEPIAKMLNDYFITSSDIGDFVGDHANGFVQKLLVNMNECQMTKNSFEQTGRIKSFITENTISLNEKHEKRIVIPNFARLIAFTNDRVGLPIDFKTGNRRFEVFQATDKYADMPEKFWEQRINQWNSPEFIPVLYEFLNNRDISNIKWRPSITKGYIEMCSQFTPIEVLFLEDFMTKGYIDTTIQSKLLYQYFVGFAERAGYKKDLIVTNHKLTNLLTDLNIGIEKQKVSGESVIYLGDLKDIRKKLIAKKLIEPDEGEEAMKVVEKEFELLDDELNYEDDESETIDDNIMIEDNTSTTSETSTIETIETIETITYNQLGDNITSHTNNNILQQLFM
jgi:putative DNA primase/helicase